MTKHQTIKKPILPVEVQLPKAIKRADVVPASGFALVVDGILRRNSKAVLLRKRPQ